jgi:hypothetical protein
MTSSIKLSSEEEAYFAKKYEGKLFVDISMFKFGNSFTINKDFYTVIGGKVCMVNDGKQQFTGDTMFDLSKDCKQIGIYHPEKIYKRVIKEYTYSEFKKLHKL